MADPWLRLPTARREGVQDGRIERKGEGHEGTVLKYGDVWEGRDWWGRETESDGKEAGRVQKRSGRKKRSVLERKGRGQVGGREVSGWESGLRAQRREGEEKEMEGKRKERSIESVE